MSNVLDVIETKVHALWAKLEAEFHPAAADAQDILNTVKAAAETDAQAVEAQATPAVETAVKTAAEDGEAVVKEAAETAVADAEKIAPAVVEDVTKAV